MKKIIAIAAAALLTVAASAQIRLGVVGGITTANTDIEHFDPSTVNNYHVGLALKVGGDFLSFQPAVVYNVKGTSFDQVLAGQKLNTVDAQFGYLELQGQFQIGVSVLGLARVYGLAEPYVGYGLTNEIQDSIQSGLKNDPIKDNWDYVNKLEYGFGVGGGIELLNMVQVSAKYYWDLGKLYNGQSLSNEDALNTALESYKAAFENKTAFSGLVISAAIFF